MATATTDRPDVTQGTWNLDQTHSSATFEVEHAGLSVFRGGFKPISATLVSDDSGLTLEGSVQVDAISVDDPNIRPHLFTPDFFDAERNPAVTFRSTEISGSSDDLTVRGELTMAGATQAVEAHGRLRGPVPNPAGGEKLAIALSTGVDRTDYGMDWQMEMPGGALALGLEVKLTVELEFDRS